MVVILGLTFKKLLKVINFFMAFAANNNMKKKYKQAQSYLHDDNKENFNANVEYQNETSAVEDKTVEENTDDNITDLNLNPVEEEDDSETTETNANNDNIGESDEDSDTMFDSNDSHTQTIIIDFTPTEEDDDDYRFEKISNFWDFIHSRKDVKQMIVMPEIKEEEPPCEKEFSQEKAIETQVETSAIEPFFICKDIFESTNPTEIPSHTPTKVSNVPTKTDLDEATEVCKELEEWDRTHPSSMEPPETKLEMYGAVMNI